VLNFRLMPGDSSDRVIAHVKEVVDDPRVAVRRFGGSNREPAAVSDANSAGFRVIGRTLRQVFPEALVAPALGPGGTDAKYFEPFTPNVYRFSPLRLKKEDLARLHGVNERSAVKDYTRSVQFYYHLIRHSAQ
jgi:carboxypeptidase PM20D1